MGAAREVMDLVLPESFLEYYPSERFDTAVLCSVLEPYPAELRQLVFQHTFEFLNPGGQVIVVISTGGGGDLCATAEDGLGVSSDLIFPSSRTSARPDEIEDELAMAGFDVVSTELLDTRPLNQTASLPDDAPKKSERRSYAVVVGQRPPEIAD